MAALPLPPLSSNLGIFTRVEASSRCPSPIAYAVLAGPVSRELVPQNLARRGLLIGNASATDNIFVCPAQDINGNQIFAGGAGSIILAPGQWINFGPETPCGVAWQVASQGTATNVPTTAWEYLI